MDPLSVATYVRSLIQIADSIANLAKLDRTTTAELKDLTRRVGTCFSTAKTKQFSAEDQVQLQKVLSSLSDVYGVVSRPRNRRDTRRALGQYREQCEILEAIFSNQSSSETLGTARGQQEENSFDGRGVQQLEVLSDAKKRGTFKPYYRLESVVHPVKATLDIVFVHGLCAKARETWTGSSGEDFWPARFLPVEEGQALPSCQILTFEYGTKDYFRKEPRFDSLVRAFGNALRDHTKQRRRQGCSAIVLVAHSLGGLLVKAAIAKYHKDIVSGLKLSIVFFGTPHYFSSANAKTTLFKAIISASASTAQSSFSKDDIEAISESAARDISDECGLQFDTLMKGELKDTRIVSFFEDDSTFTDRGNLRLVEEFNTRLSLFQDNCCLLPGNHITMCKFASRDDNGYIQFLREIKILINPAQITGGTAPVVWSETHSNKAGIEFATLEIPASPANGNFDRNPGLNSTSRKPSDTSLSTHSSDDVTKRTTAKDFSRQRPWFETPMAKWHTFKHQDQNHASWFRASKKFADWRTDQKSKALVLKGPSGCGKTVVAESILTSLSKPKSNQTAIKNICSMQLFFRFEDVVGHDLCSLLKALIAQVLDQNPILIRHVTHISGRHGRESSLSEEVLSNILCRILLDTCWQEIYLVVDGVDECSGGTSRFFNSPYQLLPESVAKAEATRLPLRTILLLLMKVPALRFVVTVSQEVYGLQPSDLLPEKLNFLLLNLCEMDEFKGCFKQFLDREVENRMRFESMQDETSNLYSKHLKQLALELSFGSHPSFRLADTSLLFFDAKWKKTSKDERSRTVWSIRFTEIQHRYVLYSELLSMGDISHDKQLHLALLYLPRLQQPVDLATLEILVRLNEDEPTDLGLAIGSLTRVAKDLNWKELAWAASFDGSGLHLCSDDIRRFCLSRLDLDALNISSDHEPQNMLDRKITTLSYEIHIRIARACLKLLRLHQKRRDLQSSAVETSSTYVPGLAYAKDFWRQHVRLAGPRASVLNSLIAQYETRTDSGQAIKPESASLILNRLATHNLSFSISTMFSDSNALADISPTAISKVFEDVCFSSTVPTLMSLNRLEKSQRKKKFQGKHIPSNLSIRHIVYLVRSYEPTHDTIEGLKTVIQDSSPDAKQHFLKYAIQFRKGNMISYIIEALDNSSLQTSSAEGMKEIWKVALSVHDQQAIEHMALKSTVFNKNTGLLIAANIADARICAILLGNKADPNHAEEDGKTALHIASQTGQLHLVELLLKWRARPTAIDTKKRTALHFATEWGHTDLVSYFLRSSTLQEELDHLGRTPFFVACSQGYKTTAAQLWSSGSNLAHRDKFGRSALHAAAANGSTDLVRLLLEAGLPVDNKAYNGRSALHEASFFGHSPVVNLLVQAGANIFAKDNIGCTPLHRACRGRTTPEVVALQLLRVGAAMDAVTAAEPPNKQQTHLGLALPLHVAAHYGTARLVEVLLNYPGADKLLGQLNGRNCTPLMCADNSPKERNEKKAILEKKRKVSMAR